MLLTVSTSHNWRLSNQALTPGPPFPLLPFISGLLEMNTVFFYLRSSAAQPRHSQRLLDHLRALISTGWMLVVPSQR